MNLTRKELLGSYIKSNVAPILIDFLEGDSIPNSVVLKSDCELKELNGYYQGVEFVMPNWFTELKNKEELMMLVIDKIDNISKEEQLKFIEILKHRKVGTYKLPDKVVIIVTAKEINERTINEKIYSLVAHVTE